MSEALVGRLAIRSKTLKPGDGWAIEMQPDELLQIVSVSGKQVSDLVACVSGSPTEVLSTAITRSKNNSIMLQKGMTIYSNLRNPLLEVVEDKVGRHDMLFAACDPKRYADDYGLSDHASCRAALTTAMEPYGLEFASIPDPINIFMNVAILSRGELELRESLAEPGDYVLLRSMQPLVAAMTACPQDQNDVNGGAPSDILVRIFR